MKKKEWLVIGILAAVAIVAILAINISQKQAEKKKEEAAASAHAAASASASASASAAASGDAEPSEKPKGQWVAIIHRNHVAKWFDSGIDGTYTVTGDYGVMHVECKDGKWHVSEVECPNQTCKEMGWDDGNNFMPITCIPNNIIIGTDKWVRDYINQ